VQWHLHDLQLLSKHAKVWLQDEDKRRQEAMVSRKIEMGMRCHYCIWKDALDYEFQLLDGI
jgi:hypothetical protein